MEKKQVKQTSMAGIAMVALGSVIPFVQAGDYLGALIVMGLGFGILGYKYYSGL